MYRLVNGIPWDDAFGPFQAWGEQDTVVTRDTADDPRGLQDRAVPLRIPRVFVNALRSFQGLKQFGGTDSADSLYYTMRMRPAVTTKRTSLRARAYRQDPQVAGGLQIPAVYVGAGMRDRL